MPIRKAQWKSDTQFNFGSPTFNNVEVIGSGDDASLQLTGVGDSSDNIPYTDPAKYTPSDVTKIEATAGKATLKNLSDTGIVIDLEGYWKMDESTWNGIPDEVIDSSINTNHGRGVPNADTVPGGKINRAGSFDGGTAEVDIPNDLSLTFETNDPFSFQCWVKCPPNGVRSLMSHQQVSGSIGVNLQIGNTGLVRMNLVGTGGSLAIDSTNTVDDDAWHHIVMTYDGSEDAAGLRIYIDNSLEIPFINANALAGSIVVTVPFKLGDREADNQPYTGLLDEVAVWSRELSSLEVTELWNGGVGKEMVVIPSYSTDDNLYIDTKDTSQISPVFVNTWLTTTITNTLPANTDIKIMFSVDGRINWRTWGGSSWDIPGDATLRANATSITDAETNFSNLPVGNGTLDARVFLFTTDSSVTPNVDNINVTSNAGYENSGYYESTQYQPKNNTNGVCLKEITYTITTPSGTTLTIEARSVNNVLEEIAGYQEYNDSDNIDLCGDIIQWKGTFTSTGQNTPKINLVEIEFHTLIGIMRAIDDNLVIVDGKIDDIVLDLALIKKIETKRWKIDNNQMIFYDDDNTTPLLTFDLKDQNGDPVEINPYERVPV